MSNLERFIRRPGSLGSGSVRRRSQALAIVATAMVQVHLSGAPVPETRITLESSSQETYVLKLKGAGAPNIDDIAMSENVKDFFKL